MNFKALILLLFMPNVWAAECTAYETIHPRYALDGSHLSTGKCATCAACHMPAGNAIYLGTPNTCYACHAGAAVGTSVLQWSAKHIPTFTTSCGESPTGCHSTTSFTTMTQTMMNHTAVAAYRCDSCHITTYTSYGATAKSKDHPTTTTVAGVKVSIIGWDCNSSGCHTTKTFDK